MQVVGIVVTKLVLTGGHTAYVRPSLGILIVIAGVLLAVIGFAMVWSVVGRETSEGTVGAAADDTAPAPDTAEDREGHPDDGHGHHRLRVGWLVLVPFIMLAGLTPAPLGAFAAGLKGSGTALPPPSIDFPPLPPAVDGAVPLLVRDFVGRVVYDPDSVRDVRVRLLGFAALDPDAPSGYLLSRFVIGCCAADAAPVQVAIKQQGPTPAEDSWIQAEGVWEPVEVEADEAWIPTLIADNVLPVEEPATPYE